MAEQDMQVSKGNGGNAPTTKSSENQGAMERARPSAPVQSRPYGLGFESPFSTMRRLTQDMDRLFQHFFDVNPWSGSRLSSTFEGGWPAIDVFERDNKLVVQADIPGLDKKDLNIEVRQGQLHITGERRSQSERQEGGYHLAERSYGRFSRTVPLPEGINPDEVSAEFNNGVLKIEVPIPAGKGSHSRRIEIH
jgi:HSP20 family protein